MNLEKITKRKGISLMILVITIVVMIIIASIIVINLNVAGIIGKAKNTVIEAELLSIQEEIDSKRVKSLMKRKNINVQKLSDFDIENDKYDEVTAIKYGELKVLNSADINLKEIAKRIGMLAKGEDLLYEQSRVRIDNTTKDEVLNYRIYGNSIQSATPSEDNPVEIQSVGNNKIDFDYHKCWFINSNGVIQGSNYNLISEYVEVEPNTTYIISMNNTYSDETTTVRGAAYDENKNYISIIYDIVRETAGIYTATFTTPANAKYIVLGTRTTDTDVKLYMSDGVTEYTYNKYIIPLIVRSKNIGSATDVYSYITKDGSGNKTEYSEITEDGRECVRFVDSLNIMYSLINFKENTQYTVQFDVKATEKYTGGTTSNCFVFWYSDGSRSESIIKINEGWTHKTFTSTAGKTVVAVGIRSYTYRNWVYIDKDTFQLEEGSAATEYTPYIEPVRFNIYLDEPLRKVEDVADYIDYINGRVVRKIGVIDSYNNESINTPYISTTGSLTAGATIYYQLDEPVYEDIDIPYIPTFNDTTEIIVDTEVEPSDVRIDY